MEYKEDLNDKTFVCRTDKIAVIVTPLLMSQRVLESSSGEKFCK